MANLISEMNTLPLLSEHEKLSPRMGDFAGWQMPLFYENAAAEHTATRESAGMFDISHMGQVYVSGTGAETFLNSLFTNDVTKLKNGRSHYSFLLNDEAGVIDDLILYRLDETSFFMVFNGARAEEAYSILESGKPADVDLHWEKEVIGLSIQGPKVADLAPNLIGAEIPAKRNFVIPTALGIAATTGYTGEHGFEWFGPIADGIILFQKALENGVIPCGLVARDSLRLEAGLPLNGQDLDRETSPITAGLGFAVKRNKSQDFRGKGALGNETHNAKKLIGFTSSGPIPRTGYEVINAEGDLVGKVTSGGRPPGYKSTIGLALINTCAAEQELSLQVRNKAFPLTITKLPFLSK